MASSGYCTRCGSLHLDCNCVQESKGCDKPFSCLECGLSITSYTEHGPVCPARKSILTIQHTEGELQTMQICWSQLSTLDLSARERALQWLQAKHESIKE